VKKSLFLVLVTAISLALLFTGNIIEDEHYAFDMLSGVMASSGVDVEGFHLEGWAVVRNIGTARSVWEKGMLGEKLGLEDGLKETTVTTEGELFQIRHKADDFHLKASVQDINNEKNNEVYILIECILSPDLRNSLAWEKKIRDALSSLGRESGIYLTVCGKIAFPMDEGALLGFGKAMFSHLGADVTGTLCTDRYVSFTGYAPQLSDAAIAGGEKINLNLAAVRKEQETQILLGTPLISCEY
jgi:hypothetical protein